MNLGFGVAYFPDNDYITYGPHIDQQGCNVYVPQGIPNVNTVTVFEKSYMIVNPQPSNFDPYDALRLVFQPAIDDCTHLWSLGGMVTIMKNARMRLEFKYVVNLDRGPYHQPHHTQYMFSKTFTHQSAFKCDKIETAMEAMEKILDQQNANSWDEDEFRTSHHLMITVHLSNFTRDELPDFDLEALGDEEDEGENYMSFGYYGYADFKSKMYHKRDLHSFYHMTDAILEVPETIEGFCFPMAFMKCQLRILYGVYPKIVETKSATLKVHFEENGSTDWMDARDPFDPYNCPRINALGTIERDFYSKENGGSIALFNPFKAKQLSHEDGFEEMYSSVTDDYKRDWLLVAQDIHQQVCDFEGREVNPHDCEDVAISYSRFFRVHLHFYTLFGTGSRYSTVVAPEVVSYQRHIHMLVDINHCAPITNIRKFMQRTTGSGRSSLHNFCDICTYSTCSSINEKKMKEHIVKCQTQNTSFKNKTFLDFEAEASSSINRRIVFANKRKDFCITCEYKAKKECFTSHQVATTYHSECNVCKEEVEQDQEGFHKCYVNTPKIKDKLPDECLWVYDIESQQNQMGEEVSVNRLVPLNIFKHECILVCMQQVYTGLRIEYATIETFCEALESDPQFDDAVILAHNGGGYDHQYVLQHCEKRMIPHSLVPHAASAHKFLCLEMTPLDRKPRRLLDFMAFVMGGLKQIGKDFGLEVAKGDFPHNFSRAGNLNYKGKIPPLKTPEDYFGYERKRNKEDQDELEAWHRREVQARCECPISNVYTRLDGIEECLTCMKPAYWDFQVELKKYCWMDVEVLSQAVKLYREDALVDAKPEESTFNWNYRGVDPFTMLTQSQVGINTFLIGIEDPIKIASTQFSAREGYNSKSNAWLRDISETQGIDIIYKGTSLKEWFYKRTDSYYSGFCIETKTVYIFYDCEYESCPICIHAGFNQRRGKDSEEIRDLREKEEYLLSLKYRVMTIWEHEFDNMVINPECRIMEDRSFFYGGRTEVFKAYAKSTEQEELKYTDVCSLYPFVCAKKSLPIDFPDIYYGKQVDLARAHFMHPNRYWGFMYCRVTPNREDLLGLLPNRGLTGRLEFTVDEQWGCWHTEELYLAQEYGYVINEVLQVFHFDENKRSDTFVRGYISYWLRQKQEAEGWKKCGGSSEDPPLEEKLQLIEALYAKNGYIGKMRIDQVKKSPVKRLIAKLKLNSWWGKWVQTKIEEGSITINGYYQYLQFLGTSGINLDNIRYRHVNGNQFCLTYKKLKGYEMLNNKYNIFIGASVTAHARCVLHREMLRIGPERIIYCDTDSIIARRPRVENSIVGGGLGDWVDEHPNERINCYYGFAPKSYNLEMEDGTNELKTKGISLTMQNKKRVTKEVMGDMLEGEFFVDGPRPEPLYLENMNITTNSRYTQIPYATLMTLYNKKVMRPVLTKRKIIRYFGEVENKKINTDFLEVTLVPIGYCRDEEHEKELSALFYDM